MHIPITAISWPQRCRWANWWRLVIAPLTRCCTSSSQRVPCALVSCSCASAFCRSAAWDGEVAAEVTGVGVRVRPHIDRGSSHRSPRRRQGTAATERRDHVAVGVWCVEGSGWEALRVVRRRRVSSFSLRNQRINISINIIIIIIIIINVIRRIIRRPSMRSRAPRSVDERQTMASVLLVFMFTGAEFCRFLWWRWW